MTVKSKKLNKNMVSLVFISTALILVALICILYGKYKSDNKKISIVVPVYNVAQYVPGCLDSLINQTYKNIEIICVNDGSKDNSLEVLNEYKQKDNRITVIDKENGGVSSARNEGIKIASGEYITFVDADDYIDLDVCEKCMKKINKENADVIYYSCILEPDNYTIPLDNETFNDPFYVLENRGDNCTVTTKIFKRSIIIDDNILFAEDVAYGEDDLFLKMVLPNARIITTLPEVKYHYVSRESSAEHTYSNEKRLISAVNRCKHMIRYYMDKKYTQRYEWILRCCIGITYGRINELDNDMQKSKYSKQVLDILNSELISQIEQIPDDISSILQDMKNYINT